MVETAITTVPSNQILRSYDDVERAAKTMAASGFFQDSKQFAQCVVKILAGQELGFGPFAAMNGVHIIQGKPTYSANIMAAAVKKSGRYNFRVMEISDDACEIAFYEGAVEIGRSRFTRADAQRAGTQNMGKYPRNMLYARAMSNGVKWFCPDVFNGSVVYTPEELGADVDENGDVIDVPAKDVTPTQQQPTAQPATNMQQVAQQAPNAPVVTQNPPANGNGKPLDPNAPASAAALKKYGEIWAEAKALGIEGKVVQPGITNAEIKELANGLRALIAAAEAEKYAGEVPDGPAA